MHTEARVSRVRGKFVVTTRGYDPGQRLFDDFSSAYWMAYEYVNWDKAYLRVEIFPDDIAEAMREVEAKHKEWEEGARKERRRKEYEELKQEFGG